MASSSKFDLDAALVRKLAKLLEETGLGEIEYADGNKKIRCAMPVQSVGAAPAVFAPSVAAPAAPAAPAPAMPAATAPGPVGAERRPAAVPPTAAAVPLSTAGT